MWKLNKILLILILGLQVNLLVAQDSNYSHELDSILGIDHLFKEKVDSVEVAYKLALDNANKLYTEQKYAEAVVYYRKALRIKPSERLPQYRIEDVFTLFLDHDVVETKEDAKLLVAEVEMSLDNLDNEELFIEKSAEPKKIEKAPLVEIKETGVEKSKSFQIKEVSPTMGIATKPIEKKIEVEKQKVVIIEKESAKEIVQETVKPVKKQIQPFQEFDNQKELLKKYTETRTVEVIKEPTLTITNIYINNGKDVVIYSKVKHSWGGIFYFAKYPLLPKKNISLQHFTKSTSI